MNLTEYLREFTNYLIIGLFLGGFLMLYYGGVIANFLIIGIGVAILVVFGVVVVIEKRREKKFQN